jgi:2-keto-4-pentenoate hydratase
VNVAAAADLLAEHRLGRREFDGFPGDLQPTDEDEGYLIQYALHERLTAAGRGALAGYKIGCTTPVMQAYLGIHNPCSGGIFAPTVQAHDASVQLAGDVRTGVECELAVRLGRDLPEASAPFTMQDVGLAVAGAMAAIEIVEDRYRDYAALAAPTLVADVSSEPVACSARSAATGALSISRRSRRAC